MSKNKRYRKLMKRAKRLQRDVTKLAHKCRLWSVGVVRCSDIVFGTRVSRKNKAWNKYLRANNMELETPFESLFTKTCAFPVSCLFVGTLGFIETVQRFNAELNLLKHDAKYRGEFVLVANKHTAYPLINTEGKVIGSVFGITLGGAVLATVNDPDVFNRRYTDYNFTVCDDTLTHELLHFVFSGEFKPTAQDLTTGKRIGYTIDQSRKIGHRHGGFLVDPAYAFMGVVASRIERRSIDDRMIMAGRKEM